MPPSACPGETDMTEQGSVEPGSAKQELAGQELIDAAQALLDLCRQKQFKLVIAESCTGGLVAATLTEIPGSSDVVDRGFVTYSNASERAHRHGFGGFTAHRT